MNSILLILMGLIGLVTLITSTNHKEISIKQKWINALRSGEFKQGIRFLFEKSSDTYCCLGVLGRVCGYNDEDLNAAYLHNFKNNSGYPKEFLIGEDSDFRGTLIAMNDRSGNSFSEIADYIEQNIPESIFK